jgi:hypothetical protein
LPIVISFRLSFLLCWPVGSFPPSSPSPGNIAVIIIIIIIELRTIFFSYIINCAVPRRYTRRYRQLLCSRRRPPTLYHR